MQKKKNKTNNLDMEFIKNKKNIIIIVVIILAIFTCIKLNRKNLVEKDGLIYNSNKSFTNSKGKSVTLGTIKDLENQYESIQKSYMFVTADRKDSLDSICNKLLRECLDVDYELVHKNSNNFDYYVFVVKGEFKKSYYSEVDSTSKLKGLVREVLKTKYFKDVNMKDNGIE